jgi:hypothetical protein
MMEKMARGFFQDLYREDPEVCPEELLGLVQPKISEDTNMEQCKDFSTEEIGDALFQMGPLKAPGPDGFPACFFQRNWEVMRKDIYNKGCAELFRNKRCQ